MCLSLFEYGVNKTFSWPFINNCFHLKECLSRNLPKKRARLWHTCLGIQEERDKMSRRGLCSWLGLVQEPSGRRYLRRCYILAANLNCWGAPSSNHGCLWHPLGVVAFYSEWWKSSQVQPDNSESTLEGVESSWVFQQHDPLHMLGLRHPTGQQPLTDQPQSTGSYRRTGRFMWGPHSAPPASNDVLPSALPNTGEKDM